MIKAESQRKGRCDVGIAFRVNGVTAISVLLRDRVALGDGLQYVCMLTEEPKKRRQSSVSRLGSPIRSVLDPRKHARRAPVTCELVQDKGQVEMSEQPAMKAASQEVEGKASCTLHQTFVVQHVESDASQAQVRRMTLPIRHVARPSQSA